MCISQDRTAFVDKVREYAPDDVNDFGRIADDLIAWSTQHDWAIQHAPRGDQKQAVVKFTLEGMNAPFWTAYPRKTDGAKLCVVDSEDVFPDSVRATARRVLAELDGRVPEENEAPTVSFQKLRSDEALRRVKQLLCHLMVELERHE